jgi:diguanylate cyclase (GGDEF)-like protein
MNDDAGAARGDRADEAERLATIDSLTGLENWRGAQRIIAREMARGKRHGIPVSCLFLDIHRFQQFNFQHGYVAGDRVLRDLSQLLLHNVRKCDVVARLGGEEFLVVLPGADLAQAEQVSHRIQARMRHQRLPIAVTVGKSTANANYDVRALVVEADQQMCAARPSLTIDFCDPDAPEVHE